VWDRFFRSVYKLVHTINKAYNPAKESNVPNKKLEIMRTKFKFISTFKN
jgi:hypothetical protein